MSFPAYPSYRDSGVEWLAEIPASWSTMPLKAVAKGANTVFIDGDWIESKDISPEGIRYITTGNVGEGAYKEQGGGYISEETFHRLNCTEVFAGDVLISRLNVPIGRACIVPDLGSRIVTSVDNVIVRPSDEIVPSYLVHLLTAKQYFAHTEMQARGTTMQRVSRTILGNIRICMPPLPEQTAIAAFLDRETAKIDALVEEQRRLIELLKEKRQAVISHAVTKGLDPTVPMKDSGVEWLGQIPAHWEVAPLKRFGEFHAGAGFPHEEQGRENEELPFYKVNALGVADADGFLSTPSDTVSRATAGRLRAYIFPAHSIVFAKIGAALLLGRIRQLATEACLDNNMMGYTLSDTNDAGFFALAMNLVKFDLISNPGTVPSLNEGQIANVVVAVPPASEQRAIAVEVKRLTERIDGLASRATDAITLLAERRAALISAAVTGKIDVREVTARQAEAA